MSIVIHGNNFTHLNQGRVVQNVIGSTDDKIMIKFDGHYFVPGQYKLYTDRLTEKGYAIVPPINQNANVNNWLGIWANFTENRMDVMCCTCGQRPAKVGGHIILENNQAQNRRVAYGLNSVFIIPICEICNGQNGNLIINRDIDAVKLFDYHHSYGEKFSPFTNHDIQSMCLLIPRQILRDIEENEINGNANYGEIVRQGKQGQQEQQGRQGRIGQPQAGQPRRHIYYNNPNARR